MKKIRKYLALGLGCILPLSLLAGCGGDKGKTDEEPLPTPDTTVAAFSDQAVTLALDGTAAKTPISDTLFGVFLEDINYAGYLLDDNLLQNGSFEAFTGALSKEWKTDGATLTVKDTGGVLAGVEEYAAKGVNAHYAEVNVTAAGGGISTEGPSMLPIAVTKGTNYLFSAFVKSSAAVTMTVKIKDATATYAEKSVELKGHSEWVKYQLTLNANETAASGISFSVSFDGTGTYLIDGIQLETADSTVGIKQYA